MRQVAWASLSESDRAAVLVRPASSNDDSVVKTVRDVVNDVRARDDKALYEYTRKFDGVEIEDFAVDANDIDGAEQKIEAGAADAIRQAYDNIYKFHENQGFQSYKMEVTSGVNCTPC